MAMKTSLEIRNEIKAHRDSLSAAAALASSEDSAVRDKAHDDMLRLGGRIDALEEQLDAALGEEASMRAEGAVPIIGAAAARPARRGIAARVLGDKARFAGLNPGYSASVPMDALSVTVPELGTPSSDERGLPTYDLTSLSPFLTTLRQRTCDGDVRYMQAARIDNKAAGWKRSSGEQKKQSAIGWEPATASLETIAHWIPIAKQSAKRYSDLETTINNELMDGLRMTCDAKALCGAEAGGIGGVLKEDKIQKFSAVAGDKLTDHARRMITKSLMATGIHPDRIVVHPLVKEAMDLAKDDTDAYLALTIGGATWGLPVVEDINMTSTDSSGATNYGMMAYWGGAATWLTADTAEVTVGLVDKQLIENSYTLLAESTHALKIVYPESFVYLEAAINVPA